ncbi:MAG TPA: response regulator transcription factor [Candidatus Binatia bacterium]|jgi:DNA-binding NarL/FixJ family response regulator|nr:response regulator transcription factor [Candidatus Binatia bacterium]
MQVVVEARRIGVEVAGGERLVREGLVAALDACDDLTARDAGAGGDAAPIDVLVVLGGMPPARDQRIPLVVVDAFRERADVVAAIDAGVRACVSQTSGLEPLLAAIHSAAAGRGYLCPTVGDVMCRPSAADAHRVTLTDRERDILSLVAQGLRNGQIAVARNLSIKTVHAHRQNIMAKLGVRGATQLVRRAIQLGLIAA